MMHHEVIPESQEKKTMTVLSDLFFVILPTALLLEGLFEGWFED